MGLITQLLFKVVTTFTLDKIKVPITKVTENACYSLFSSKWKILNNFYVMTDFWSSTNTRCVYWREANRFVFLCINRSPMFVIIAWIFFCWNCKIYFARWNSYKMRVGNIKLLFRYLWWEQRERKWIKKTLHIFTFKIRSRQYSSCLFLRWL